MGAVAICWRSCEPPPCATGDAQAKPRLAHRLDLLWAKGRLPSIAAILAESSSLSMVILPT